MNALEAEIDAAKRSMRQLEEAGRVYDADLASARLWGLIRARQIMFGDDLRPACEHLVHHQVDGTWRCVRCDDPHPHG